MFIKDYSHKLNWEFLLKNRCVYKFEYLFNLMQSKKFNLITKVSIIENYNWESV